MSNRKPSAHRVQGFGTTIFTEMTGLAIEHRAVNLSQGFPDFEGPDFLKRAAVRAIEADRNQYARMAGEPALVEAIAAQMQARFGLFYDPLSEITVTSGATEAIHDAFLAFVDPGDEVVLFEPYYDSYRACAAMVEAKVRCVTLRAPDFRWEPRELEAAIGPSTRLIVLNTPHNPTGRVFSAPELEQIADLCRRHDVLCLADEVYERLVYDDTHVPIASLPGMRERTVLINSTGKTFSLTGWKIGYALAPAALSAAFRSAHQFVTFATATPFQHAMVEAIGAGEDYYRELLAAYRARRDLLADGLSSAGFAVTIPEGAYFVVADIRPLRFTNDVEFCRWLVRELGVAAIPMTAFYDRKEAGDFLVRFAFCKRRETLEAALTRLAPLAQRRP